MPSDLKHKSRELTEGPGRAPARAMLRAVGLTDDDLSRPLVAVANTWSEVTPCNFHLRQLAEKVKAGIREAGGTPIEFNTIVISDGISMGTEGMKASLISREVVADSIELVVRGHLFDAVVALSGCDKTIPGTVMALARLNLPSLMLYGGSIMPGQFQGHLWVRVVHRSFPLLHADLNPTNWSGNQKPSLIAPSSLTHSLALCNIPFLPRKLYSQMSCG